MISTKLELYNDGSKVAELIDAVSFTYGERRNDFRNGKLTYRADKLTPELRTYLVAGSEVRVLRKAEFEDTYKQVWAGEIQEFVKEIDEKNQKNFTAEVVHWGNVFLKNRFITKTYAAQEEEDIAWDIINETQTDTLSGAFTLAQVDWGITQGTLEATGNTRDREYVDDEILKSLQQLSNVKDIVPNPQRLRGFRLTPDLVDGAYHEFSYYADYGEQRNVIYNNPLISKVREAVLYKSYANRIKAVGDGMIEYANSTNTAELNIRKMREKQVSKTNVQTAGALEEEAEEELRLAESITSVYSIQLVPNDPFTGLYRTGDRITIDYHDDDEFIEINNLEVIVFGIDIQIDEKGQEKTSLIVATERPKNINSDLANKLTDKLNDLSDRTATLEK